MKHLVLATKGSRCAICGRRFPTSEPIFNGGPGSKVCTSCLKKVYLMSLSNEKLHEKKGYKNFLFVEPARSSQSTCCSCGERIPKGVYRIRRQALAVSMNLCLNCILALIVETESGLAELLFAVREQVGEAV